MENWAEDFAHASVDTDKAAFNSAMAKYATKDDAIVGGFNAMKAIGKPFKMPESLDNLPDDASRTDFTSKARGLLGINIPKNVEALADLDMKSGFVDGQVLDENLSKSFKDFIVESGMQKSVAQKAVAFHNKMMAAAKVSIKEAAETDKIAKAETCNQALIAKLGSKEEEESFTQGKSN